METNDVFANDVVIDGPPLLEHLVIGAVANCGDVVGKCVEPHVGNVRVIKRKGNAPRQCLSADREILQALLNEAKYFIHAVIGNNCTRM